MADKKYPLDITVACSIGLEGGLARYRDELPYFSRDDFDLVHEWNSTLKQTLKQPEFKQNISGTYRVLLNLSPVTVSRIIDRLSVPYRSYYYAKRFLDAADFVYTRAGGYCNVVDFGRGLSPWGHIVKKQNRFVNMHTFDNNITNAVFETVTNKMNLENPHFNELPNNIVFDRDMFVSLGTFVYLPKPEQSARLRYVSQNFKNLFIELEDPYATQDDKKLVNNMGANYNSGFTANEIQEVLNNKNLDWKLLGFANSVKNTRMAQLFRNATERFLIR